MVLKIILLIVLIALFVCCCYKGATCGYDEDNVYFAGCATVVTFILLILMAFVIFDKKEVYLNKYDSKIENISELRIDTTFTTTNNITDTIYTVYFN